jgi:hypothetical protein
MKLTQTHGYLKLNRRKNEHGVVIIIPGSHPVLDLHNVSRRKRREAPYLN